MTDLEAKCPRRQAMLSVGYDKIHIPEDSLDECYIEGWVETSKVPVLVWPNPTPDGYFIVEHQNGKCEKVHPNRLTFLDGKKFFDQYDWGEEAAENKDSYLCDCDSRGDAK